MDIDKFFFESLNVDRYTETGENFWPIFRIFQYIMILDYFIKRENKKSKKPEIKVL